MVNVIQFTEFMRHYNPGRFVGWFKKNETVFILGLYKTEDHST